MAWTAPATVVTDQLMTAAFWNEQVRDNQLALHTGGIACASQGSTDLVVTASGTQVARVAGTDGDPIFLGAWTILPLIQYAHRVGTIYASVVSTNPNTLLGFGTWVAVATGRILIGQYALDPLFATVRQTGGSATQSLTATELPFHAHTLTDPGHTHMTGRVAARGEGGFPQHGNPRDYPGTNAPDVTSYNATGITVNSAGGGDAHNNLPPYIVCYLWERTA